jgi:hypothetical protein
MVRNLHCTAWAYIARASIVVKDVSFERDSISRGIFATSRYILASGEFGSRERSMRVPIENMENKTERCCRDGGPWAGSYVGVRKSRIRTGLGIKL